MLLQDKYNGVKKSIKHLKKNQYHNKTFPLKIHTKSLKSIPDKNLQLLFSLGFRGPDYKLNLQQKLLSR